MPNRIVISETGGPEVLKYEQYNLKDKIDDNNVRIKHHSIGINYIDTYHRSGLYPLPHNPPICPGLEASGEIQCAGLGMDVDIYDKNSKSLIDKKGELVCKTPFPSKPLYFWNDPGNKKYLKAYFEKYPNVWHHGDYCKKTSNNGYIIYG